MNINKKIKDIYPDSYTEYGNFRKKKSLGQNFLKSNLVLKMMCKASDLNKEDVVLEIGPGKGALTTKLLEVAKKVIAIEKDSILIKYLQEKFKEEIHSNRLILIEDDILNFSLDDFNKNNLLSRGYKIIANIPYNITGLIFKKFLSSEFQPEIMTLMLQKEVAKRIIGITSSNNKKPARFGKESILSLSIKAYGTPLYIMKVKKRFFSPSPKVDSAIITIKNISKDNFKSKEKEKIFFDIVKMGFAHKRKLLRKNLETNSQQSSKINEIFKKLGIDPKVRAENVCFEDWLKMAKYF